MDINEIPAAEFTLFCYYPAGGLFHDTNIQGSAQFRPSSFPACVYMVCVGGLDIKADWASAVFIRRYRQYLRRNIYSDAYVARGYKDFVICLMIAATLRKALFSITYLNHGVNMTFYCRSVTLDNARLSIGGASGSQGEAYDCNNTQTSNFYDVCHGQHILHSSETGVLASLAMLALNPSMTLMAGIMNTPCCPIKIPGLRCKHPGPGRECETGWT